MILFSCLWNNSFKRTPRNRYQATELALFSLCFPFPVFTSTSSDECPLTLFLQLSPKCLTKSCPFESSLVSVVFVSMSGQTPVCCQCQSRALCWEFSDVLISQVEWDTLLWPMQCPSRVRERAVMEDVVVVVHLLICVQLFATPQTAALSFTTSQSLLKLVSSEAMMPSNHPILCCPLLLLSLIFHSSRVFFNASALHIRWPKFWSFSFSTSPSSDGVCGRIFIRHGRVNMYDLIVPYPQDYLQFQPYLFD